MPSDLAQLLIKEGISGVKNHAQAQKAVYDAVSKFLDRNAFTTSQEIHQALAECETSGRHFNRGALGSVNQNAYFTTSKEIHHCTIREAVKLALKRENTVIDDVKFVYKDDPKKSMYQKNVGYGLRCENFSYRRIEFRIGQLTILYKNEDRLIDLLKSGIIKTKMTLVYQPPDALFKSAYGPPPQPSVKGN